MPYADLDELKGRLDWDLDPGELRIVAGALLEQSFASAWTDCTYWRNRYAGAPVRLWVRCRREGHQPWVLTHNVDVANPQ